MKHINFSKRLPKLLKVQMRMNKDSRPTTKGMEKLSESNVYEKASEVMNKNALYDSILIETLSNLLKSGIKGNFRLYDYPGCDNWMITYLGQH